MTTTVYPPFDVTEAAIDKITSLGGEVRLDLSAGGCCGTTYVFEQTAQPDDLLFGCPGAVLAVSPAALDVMRSARLDYNPAIKPPRFRVLRNPNTPDRCPCNRSFGEPWPGRGNPACAARHLMPWDDG